MTPPGASPRSRPPLLSCPCYDTGPSPAPARATPRASVLDRGRALVTPILNRQLGQFEALALIRIAADFYRRALQIRKSPEVENALTAVTQ